MPVKPVTNEWSGQDAFIIGGGSSLKGYDFNTLRGHNCLGVNDAFRLGPEVCPRILFGDDSWWQRVKFDLEEYVKGGGRIHSIAPASITLHCPWLEVSKRIDSGWGSEEWLGWNNSTGAAAMNLAVNLGAKRIFLLGFDCSAGPDQKTHWHSQRRTPTHSSSFDRFMRGFDTVARQMQKSAPDVLVLNCSPLSRLTHWQKCTLPDMERLMNEPH